MWTLLLKVAKDRTKWCSLVEVAHGLFKTGNKTEQKENNFKCSQVENVWLMDENSPKKF